MTRMGCQHLWMLPLLLTVARAQEGPVDKLPARVTGPGPAGTVLVDRGERDNGGERPHHVPDLCR